MSFKKDKCNYAPILASWGKDHPFPMVLQRPATSLPLVHCAALSSPQIYQVPVHPRAFAHAAPSAYYILSGVFCRIDSSHSLNVLSSGRPLCSPRLERVLLLLCISPPLEGELRRTESLSVHLCIPVWPWHRVALDVHGLSGSEPSLHLIAGLATSELPGTLLT